MTPPPHARSPRSLLVLVLVVAGMCVGAGKTVQAQEFGRLQNMKERTNVAYFYFAPPGEATVQVQVQGTVPRPGLYEVADSTDLSRLLTFSGGAALEPRPENRDRPEIKIRVYRPGAQGRSRVLDASFEQILSGKKQFQQFRDGDIIVVETVQQRNFTWRDLLSIGSSVVSVALLVVRLVEIRN